MAFFSCSANERGQKAESSRQKICLNRASSVTLVMRSRGSTSLTLSALWRGVKPTLPHLGIWTLTCSTEQTCPKVHFSSQQGKYLMLENVDHFFPLRSVLKTTSTSSEVSLADALYIQATVKCSDDFTVLTIAGIARIGNASFPPLNDSLLLCSTGWLEHLYWDQHQTLCQ